MWSLGLHGPPQIWLYLTKEDEEFLLSTSRAEPLLSSSSLSSYSPLLVLGIWDCIGDQPVATLRHVIGDERSSDLRKLVRKGAATTARESREGLIQGPAYLG